MIYTVTLNPALDRELVVPELRYNEVLRATGTRLDFGGKGFNVSRLLMRLGEPSVALGFSGGATGRLLQQGLEALGIRTDFVWVAAETRTNVSIVGTEEARYIKVNEAGPLVGEAEQAELLAKVQSLARQGDWWILAGSLPPGIPADYYAEIVQAVQTQGAHAILDTSGRPLALACEAAPFLVKPNREEAAALTGMSVSTPAEVGAAAEAIRKLGPRMVVVSMGSLGAVLSDGEGVWLARSPQIEEKNPIGAGDSLVGAMVWAMSHKLSAKDALCWGVASGAATAGLAGTEVGDRNLIEQLLTQVQVMGLNSRSGG